MLTILSTIALLMLFTLVVVAGVAGFVAYNVARFIQSMMGMDA